jgi:hypothetical protein
VLLEIRSFDEPLIYTNTVATGLGTPSPLLDRSDTGDSARGSVEAFMSAFLNGACPGNSRGFTELR